MDNSIAAENPPLDRLKLLLRWKTLGLGLGLGLGLRLYKKVLGLGLVLV